jgi:hypothetical protein
MIIFSMLLALRPESRGHLQKMLLFGSMLLFEGPLQRVEEADE